ncbi:hypothetical protein [Lentzea sp. NPDC055074]
MPEDLEGWREQVRDAGLGFADDRITLALTLALPALFPLRDRRSTESLLGALPGFAAGRYDVHRTADVLVPVESGDELVRDALAAYGEPDRGADVLVDALRAVAPPDRPHALEALFRLAAADGVAAQAADLALSQALTDAPDDYLPALAQVAKSVTDHERFAALLRQAFPAASYEAAADAYLGLPHHDSRLAAVIAEVVLDLVSRRGPGTGPAHRASTLIDVEIATRMLDGHQPERAAAFADRAATDAATQDLRARALIVLSRAVADLGHPWYAREKADEAVALARPLGDTTLLLDALHAVVACNHGLKEHALAEAAALEALDLSRTLGPEDQAVALALASAVCTGERATQFAAESVAVLRGLTARAPARHQLRFIAALNNYAAALGDAHETAFEVGQEALLLIQDLHRRDPDAHAPQYAQVVLNFSNRLAARGDHANALEGYRTATRVLHELIPQLPHVYAAKCATALWGLATAFVALHRWSEAETAVRGMITLLRGCVRESQPWVIPDLLKALDLLKDCLARAKQFAELPALEAEQQALRLLHARYRKLSGPAVPPR